MKALRSCALAAALCAGMGGQAQAQVAASAVNVDAYIKLDTFQRIKISPSGEYFAATVPYPDRTVLAILRRSDSKITGSLQMGKNTHVDDLWWVNPTRVLVSTTEKYGSLDRPQPTGELYAINANGSGADLLVGYRVDDGGAGTHIKPKKRESVAAFLVDDLPHDDESVVIAVSPFVADPYTRAERMNVNTGRRVTIARAPVRNADFVTDNAGVVRFAYGQGTDLISKLYYRASEKAEWTLLNDESATGRGEWAVGFSPDNSTAYLEVEQDKGPNMLVAYDVASGKRTPLLGDDSVDPAIMLTQLGGLRAPVGAMYLDGKPSTAFFDKAAPEARLYRSLEAAFPDDSVLITSTTADGKTALVRVASDRNPGDFYLFDVDAKKAEHLIARRDWFDPAKMGRTRAFTFDARDGLRVSGLLTTPAAGGDRGLPMVVLPHGGPFGIYDTWGFDSEVQMLADAGYAVLQVNYRGSGNYGRSFRHAGRRQWGGAMQDDLTDATRWAIAQGHADSKRICIYGGSYGAYAALMGVAKEPDLYRCAVGYVGLYDLPTMHTHGDIQENASGRNYVREWVGEKAELEKVSPNRLANRIKVPVFLAAGGEDRRTPIEHTKMMERALKSAGVPVETLYYDSEGHGFYTQEHRKEYYTRLLAFLNRSLGGATAAP